MPRRPFAERLARCIEVCAPLREHLPAGRLDATDAAIRALLAIGHDPRVWCGAPERRGQPRLRWASGHGGYAALRAAALIVAALLAGALPAGADITCRIGETICYTVPGTICTFGGVRSVVPCSTASPTPTAGPGTTPTPGPTPAGEPDCDEPIEWRWVLVPVVAGRSGQGASPPWVGLFTDYSTWYRYRADGTWCRVPSPTPTLPAPRRHLTLP
ncbi:MAG: hypothetical protein PHU75_03910 [Candidatus Nanopelagicales bacterium]|nr:hypothetical protein [Candidatus Nanopelagicales bacterium]